VSLAAGTARGQGSDTLRHIQNVVGGRFNDTLIGDDRSNGLEGAAGDDELIGRGGGDFLVGGKGKDTIDGGAGNDVCSSGENVSKCEAAKASSRPLASAIGSPRRCRPRLSRRVGDLGIEAMRGVIDDGGTVAHHNGDPRQCTHIVCN
jgi:hypothetical protein